MDCESGVNRCKLVHIQDWMNNESQMNSTGNYIQYSMINHNGKNIKKQAYITESLCYTAETNTIL